ncbi:hypothetical protein RJJ37_04050 [Rhizobium redzepovicii]|uniref:Uncharacterized protein n=1 Tax=Rhizobium redzepovicii TaxID=2867518 RepID=A0AAW8NVY8_9HYPH|nr:hypothetical protein [Rhizobium redzepovicii]MDR9758812.1 hypothetical protein [Rhizobium redzepovicii]
MTGNASNKFEIWQQIILSPKSVFNWPSWVDGSMYRESRRQAKVSGRLPLISDLAARLEMIISLANSDDIALEDVRIRLMVWKNRPMEDVTATFEIYDIVRWACASRIDFVPVSPHPNKHWRKYALEPEVNGSHIHTCEDNAKIGPDAFAPVGNLPNARGLDREPQSFKDVCQQVGQLFNVTGLQDLPPPDWNWSML